MIAEALVLMPNEEYWINFSKEQNITPLCKTEVLQEYMCNENTLKHHLIKIWQNEFGIDTIKYPKFEITFFKKSSQDIYKKFEIEALTAEIAYEKIINEDEANSESPYKYEGFKNLEYSCKTIILNKDLVVNTKNYSIGIYSDENRGWFEHYKYGDEQGGGLWFNSDKELTDYDGISSLPLEVVEAIRGLGYKVDQSFYSEN